MSRKVQRRALTCCNAEIISAPHTTAGQFKGWFKGQWQKCQKLEMQEHSQPAKHKTWARAHSSQRTGFTQ